MGGSAQDPDRVELELLQGYKQGAYQKKRIIVVKPLRRFSPEWVVCLRGAATKRMICKDLDRAVQIGISWAVALKSSANIIIWSDDMGNCRIFEPEPDPLGVPHK